MPVYLSQIPGNGSSYHQCYVRNGRTEPELFHPVRTDKVFGNKSGREWYNHPRTNTEHGTDSDKLPHLTGKQIKNTA